MNIATLAMMAATTIATPAQDDRQKEFVCPSDPVTCWFTQSNEFDCNQDALTCWLGTYRDPKEIRPRPTNEGW